MAQIILRAFCGISMSPDLIRTSYASSGAARQGKSPALQKHQRAVRDREDLCKKWAEMKVLKSLLLARAQRRAQISKALGTLSEVEAVIKRQPRASTSNTDFLPLFYFSQDGISTWSVVEESKSFAHGTSRLHRVATDLPATRARSDESSITSRASPRSHLQKQHACNTTSMVMVHEALYTCESHSTKVTLPLTQSF